jgi:osmoprotectant transport system substrate-binding protein
MSARDKYITISTADRSTISTWGSRQPPPPRMRKENNIIMSTLHSSDHSDTPYKAPTPSRRRVLTRALASAALTAAVALPFTAMPSAHAASPKAHAAKLTLTVGAKGFPENDIVAYMYVLLLQHAGIPVNSSLKDNLASQTATPALQRGDLDIFPEYTGTGLETILQQKAAHDTIAYYDAVAKGYRQKYNLIWLNPYPMNDTNAFATTQSFAKQNHIYSIPNMVSNASKVKLIVDTEYLGRADGLPGVQKIYGNFQSKLGDLVKVQGVGSVRYAALTQGRGNVVEAFSTDPQIASDHLVVLSDPKNYAPPDNLAPVVRYSALQTYPKIRPVLNQIASKITTSTISQLSAQVAIQHQDAKTVAQNFLQKQGFLK